MLLGLDGGLTKEKRASTPSRAPRPAPKARPNAVLQETATTEEAPTNAQSSTPRSQSAANASPVSSKQVIDSAIEADAELGRTAAKLKLLDETPEFQRHPTVRTVVPMWKPSDQIHVLGLDLPGRYIAHALAGCETIPPVRYLIHDPHLFKTWEAAGRRFTLEVPHEKQTIVHNRVIGEYVPRLDSEYRPGRWPVSDEVIENLIVTVPAGYVLRALEPIVHRLDHRSSICLVQDGLGIAEAIVDAYFPNEITRPAFILGHLATALGHPTREDRFAVTEVHQRKLYLTLFTPRARGLELQHIIKRHPPTERVLRQTHLLRLLTAIPGLHVHGHPMVDWLRNKLFVVGFRAIADPLATLFDCPYDKIAENKYAKQLMDVCLNELCDVVTRLPECRNAQKFRRFYLGPTLREQFIHALKRRKTADSKMRANTARGWDTDVDYLTGYFVRQGRELRVPVNALEALMLSVKAKQLVAQQRRDAVIPFEEAYPRKPHEEDAQFNEAGEGTERSERSGREVPV